MRGAQVAAALLLLSGCAATLPGNGTGTPSAANDTRFPAAPMREEVLTLPGDPVYPVDLQATLFLPPGAGPFPLAVMNHGATNASNSRRGDRYRFTTSAYYFLSRGYAVLLPMARGFAGSGGALVHEKCDLVKVARRNGADIAGAIAAVARRPDIDRSRIVVAGQSFGGWSTLGLGTEAPPGVRALIAFNPAIRASDCNDQDNAMESAAAAMGARTSLPALWFFGENDSVMPNATWKTMFARYSQANARAELVDIGPFGSDSHQMLSAPGSLPMWTPKADAFLAGAGLPAGIVNPQFLPHTAPAATHFAALGDVSAVPVPNEATRGLYRKFLTEPMPRAFVIAPGHGAAQSSGGYDPIGFALRSCGTHAPNCRLYAVDDRVVWQGDPAPPRQ